MEAKPPAFVTPSLKPPAHATPSLEVLEQNAAHTLNVFAPCIWCLLFIVIMDWSSFVSLLYVPVLGVFAACLANAVPIGGGVVYVPALYLLGLDVQLGAAFSIATMPIGNGIFGFLRWLIKDKSLIVWKSFLYTVVPSSIGSFIAILLLPEMNDVFIKRLFAVFCSLLCIFVYLSIYRDGLDKVISIAPESESAPLAVGSEPSESIVGSYPYEKLAIVSFLAGLILVPNIAIGPGMITYLMLILMKFPPKAAMVTGVITGGWVCILPFLLHLVVLRDVPLRLWIMVIPGVYFGAMIAPFVHEYLGQNHINKAFAVFLLLTALLFFFH